PAIWDNFPNALLEAMALGKPIVATSGSGIAEIIEHERSGLLVQPDDAQALAAGLELALSDKSLRERLGGEAQKRVRELCDPAQIVSRMEALIRRSSPSMRRQFRRWRELAPAAESRSVIQMLRRSRLARRLLHARRRV
ncbi:MAG: glycosyltransferase family 4 protein, partial [Planctomycetes bacterium]|nr:glycosyltransferase family 4 protein [Planctomycetota bacterium]